MNKYKCKECSNEVEKKRLSARFVAKCNNCQERVVFTKLNPPKGVKQKPIKLTNLVIVTGREVKLGRKPKFIDKTTTIAFRVPVCKKGEVKAIVDAMIQGWQL